MRTRFHRFIIVLAVFLTLPLPALAATATPAPAPSVAPLTDLYSIFNNSPFFAENDCLPDNGEPAIPTSTTVNASQAAREKAAFLFFSKKFNNTDMGKKWAAGIVGNLVGESGVNPASDNPAASGGGGGIAQWEGSRWDNLLEFAKDHNAKWYDLNLQLEFLWHELQTYENAALKSVMTTTSVRQAAIVFMLKFERPSIPRTQARVDAANRVYEQNKDAVPTFIGPVVTPNTDSNTDVAVDTDVQTCEDSSADAVEGNGTCPPGTDAGQRDGYRKGVKHVITVCKIYGIIVNATIAAGLKKLVEDGGKAGLHYGGGGFRSMEEQIKLRQASCGTSDYDIYRKPSSQCAWPVAQPGYSNHQMGEAVDFNNIEQYDPRNPLYLWLKANASKYGLQNFPKEHWHWSRDGK